MVTCPASSPASGVRSVSGEPDAAEGLVDLVGPFTWYRSVGPAAGSVVVVLHGGPGYNSAYLRPLDRLGDQRRVVFYDQFGAGRSTPATGVEDEIFTVDLFVRELSALREALGLDRVHLIGQSWGCMLALEHVLSGATGIASLTLMSGLASIQEWQRATLSLRDALPPDMRAVLSDPDDAARSSERYRNAMAEYEKRHVLRIEPTPPWEAAAEELFERNRRVYDVMTGGSEFGRDGEFGRLTGWDVRPRLHTIDVPTLLLSGRHDEATPAVVATLAEGIEGATWHLLENSSHSCHSEETELVLSLIAAFLDEVDEVDDVEADRA
jgi:L-proline amide hydrolase